jgi:DNA-binding MarR family transcriptional regulator
MFNLDDCIAYITKNSAKKLAAVLGRRIAFYEITLAQWIALFYIGRDGRIKQKELSEKMMITEPTVSGLLVRMGKKGYVRRFCCKEDKRARCLGLTPLGEHLNGQLCTVANQFVSDATAGISQEDLTIFKNVLTRMLANVQTS